MDEIKSVNLFTLIKTFLIDLTGLEVVSRDLIVKYREFVVNRERIVLRELGFVLKCDYFHSNVATALECIGIKDSEFCELCIIFVNECLYFSLIVLGKKTPTVIAVSIFAAALRWQELELKNDKDNDVVMKKDLSFLIKSFKWLSLFETTKEDLLECIQQLKKLPIFKSKEKEDPLLWGKLMKFDNPPKSI